jgi:hypothetical protein
MEGLQGHDWLRTMGVSGITESRKKTFEPARQHFIKGCKSILEKFKAWGLEEKRRKQEKDRALAEEARAREEEEEDIEEAEVDENDEQMDEDDEEAVDGEPLDDEDADGSRSGRRDTDPPDSSDVDESIAKQLREDAMFRSKVAAKSTSKRGRTAKTEKPPDPEPEPVKEIASFFEKKYQRDAALSKSRRKGRTVMAWGHPVPEPSEADFELPEDVRDGETMKAHARRKRRDKRAR